MTTQKELAIIGAGPAGITAAVYAARKKLDFTVVTRDVGGQAAWSGEIGNYPSYQYISGAELVMKMREHLETFKFELKEGQGVTGISREEQGYKVTLQDGVELTAKSVILATGKRPRLLNVPGEAKYLRKGVNFCATCDAPLFGGKNVAVIGGGNSALDAALQLVRIARKVYVINNTPALNGDPVMIEKLSRAAGVEIVPSAKVVEFFGERFLQGIKVETFGVRKDIPVEGAFIEIGLIPNSTCVDFVAKNERGEIVINAANETSAPGLFAAGDVTNVLEKQIVIAAGEGAKAALSAYRFLASH
ncbi:MAG: FAD-dependent oxidoreductase [Candidatus Margulisbacteria bacterium]|jgi:alkyl hydroperoxide reductase subunit F|nr:FAD-dependent oxidoreductase [Candidatus Margulisiibacteriota bacterium]